MKTTIALASLVPVIVAVGSVLRLSFVPWLVVGYVVTVATLLLLGRLKHTPIWIYSLALALLWQTTMLGTWVVGVDIHTELMVANWTTANGWEPSWANNSNTSLVLTLLSPALADLGIPVVWQFKALFPAVAATVPMILCLAYRKGFGERVAVLGALFFAIMPMFLMEMVSMVKSEIAYVGMAVIVLGAASCEWTTRKRAVVVVGGALVAIFSHYSVATMVAAYAAAMGIGTLVWGLGRVKWVGMVGLLVVGVYVAFFVSVSQGSVLRETWAIGRNIAAVTKEVATAPAATAPAATANTTVPSEGLLEQYKDFTRTDGVTRSYLDMQSPLVRTALGLDFGEASGWGKVFRVLQFATEIGILLGLRQMWKRRRDVGIEYVMGVAASVGLLGMVVFVPFLATALSPTRFYALTLFWLAPVGILGLKMMARRWWAVAGVLGIYYLFTSGMVLEATQGEVTERMDVPYGFAFSAERLGLIGVYTDGDVRAAAWLWEKTNRTIPIWIDYLGTSLLLEHAGSARQSEVKPGTEQYYLLLTDWNARHGEMVSGWYGGLRERKPTPDVSGMVEVFRDGNTVVFWTAKGAMVDDRDSWEAGE